MGVVVCVGVGVLVVLEVGDGVKLAVTVGHGVVALTELHTPESRYRSS